MLLTYYYDVTGSQKIDSAVRVYSSYKFYLPNIIDYIMLLIENNYDCKGSATINS